MLIGLDQRIDHLNTVLEMHIVVAGAVHEQQRTMQLSGRLRYRAFVIPFGVVFRQPHIALGIDSVIVAVIGDGCDRNSGLKSIGVRHRIKRHRRAIRPAPHRDPVLIELRILSKHLGQRSELILQLNRAELMPDRSAECPPAVGCAPIVHCEDGKSFA